MNNSNISIIDYGMGNLLSVSRACDFVGMSAKITSKIDDITNSDAIILPGVGAFGNAMSNLKKLDLINPIIDFCNSSKPVLGICLGMQLLLSESNEFGLSEGLGIIEGRCKKFPSDSNFKVPQISWNQIWPHDFKDSFDPKSPLKNIKIGEYMYFVHSYYVEVENEKNILSKTNYANIDYCSSIKKGNIYAFQFHPEKSGAMGLNIYKNFNDLINDKKQ